jgi:serine/threonine protein kinase
MTGLASTSKVDPPGKLSLVGRKLGRYEVLARLASGGMAEVYIARAQGVAGFERLVAIKVLHANLAHEEQFITMFLDEARLAARIRHPNVVATLDISGTEETGYFLVMEYIEGEHVGHLLATAVKENEPIPVPVTLRMIVDALAGLGAAHSLTDESGNPLNLVHRDVSPHNILVGVDGVARLTDFGVAKAEVRLSHTREGQIKGKLAYMAPEQASSGKTDARSDLFSIGVILWETLTGKRLFRSETTAAVLNKLLSEEIAPPSSVVEELKRFDEVVLKSLDRDPDKRYQTADEFIDAIEVVASKSSDGIARRRDVGKVVERYAADKLFRDRHRVKEAIRAIGQTPLDTRPGGTREDTESSMRSADSAGIRTRYSPSVSGVSKVGEGLPVKNAESLSSGGAPRPVVIQEEQELNIEDLEQGPASSSMLSAIDAVRTSREGVKWLVWFAATCLLLAVVAIGALIYQQWQEVQVQVREIAPRKPVVVKNDKPKSAPIEPAVQPQLKPTTAKTAAPETQLESSASLNSTEGETRQGDGSGQGRVKKREAAPIPDNTVSASQEAPGTSKPRISEKTRTTEAAKSGNSENKAGAVPSEKSHKIPQKQEPSPDDIPLVNPYLR